MLWAFPLIVTIGVNKGQIKVLFDTTTQQSCPYHVVVVVMQFMTRILNHSTFFSLKEKKERLFFCLLWLLIHDTSFLISVCQFENHYKTSLEQFEKNKVWFLLTYYDDKNKNVWVKWNSDVK